MQPIYRFIVLALITGGLLMPAQQAVAQAGDTLMVEWQDANGDVKLNALRDAIANDTNRPEGRVYLLRQGGFYWNSDRIENDGFHLRIVGEEPGPGELENPPVIQMVENDEGVVDARMITGLSDVTLKNVYIVGADNNGVQTAYQPVQMDASDARFVFDNVIFERSNFAIPAFTGTNNDIFFTNCTFRNLIGQPSTQQWEGRGISIWADQDTVIVENCTFFHLGMTAFQLEGGAARYVRFNHNTLVNVGRSINAGNWWREAYFANNLIINGFWHSEGAIDLSDPNRDPRATTAGLFSIGSLPSQYGPEEGRRIVFANTAAWLDPAFVDYYSDSLRIQPFMNPITKQDFVAEFDAMVAQDTVWLENEPGLGTYNPEITSLIPDMIQNIQDLRAGNLPANPYFFQLETLDDGSVCNVCISWPPPEDFSYTDPNLLTAGTDGLPLGDLNWFPDKKAQWEANKEQFIAEIEALAGQKREFRVTETAEAEDGSLGGDATVETFQGFSFYRMDGGGYLEWAFDMSEATTVDLIVYYNNRGNDQRGQRIIVNGTNIRNDAGFGEFMFRPDPPFDQWTSVTITQADLIEGADALNLPAGENTIRISHSWGFQSFSGIDVLEAGTSNILKELRAPDVTDFSIVVPVGEGAAYTPSRFKSVALNDNGSVSWDMTAPTDGTYRIQVFYQAPNGTQTGQVALDGETALPSVQFEGVAGDSSGQNVLSDGFDLTAGTHTITLSGSQVIVDFVQLIQEVITSVSSGHDELPLDFELAQNYPNPFNPETTIRYRVAQQGEVTIEIFNILGQKVRTLVDKVQPEGSYRVVWDGTNDYGASVSTGMYIYRMKSADFVKSRKMLFLK